LVVAVFAVSLLLPGLGLFRIGRRVEQQSGPATPEQKREESRMGRIFGLVFAAEGVLILVAANVLRYLHLDHCIPSAIALIVGLHFLPLARLYRRPEYTVVGWVMSALAVASLALPSPVRESTVGLGMATLLWVTCALILRKAFRLGRSFRPAQASV
jgi:uncharacterized membrane protein (UPF0136 family)